MGRSRLGFHGKARIVRALGAALVCGALLGACDHASTPDFQNVDITGSSQFAGNFALPDTSGKVRRLSDFKDRAVVMMFGYTHCPDVCPTTLAELTQALQQLGPDAARRVQVIFVTVDPARDTDAVLQQYVTAFNPGFIALRPANDAQLKQVADDFRVYYAQVKAKTPGDYTMDHTAASFVFDPQGKLRLFARDGQGVAPWVHDLQLLLG